MRSKLLLVLMIPSDVFRLIFRRELHFFISSLVKFGLSEKRTKFEKIFLVVLTNQLIYLVNIKTMRKIFSNYVCFSKSPNFKMHWDRYVLILAFLNRNWLRSQLWAMTHCHQPMLLMPILVTSQTVQIWRIQAFWECFSDLSCPILIQTILIHHNYKMKGKPTIFCRTKVKAIHYTSLA